MVDPVVSADVGHLGTFNYNIHCQGLELDS